MVTNENVNYETKKESFMLTMEPSKPIKSQDEREKGDDSQDGSTKIKIQLSTKVKKKRKSALVSFYDDEDEEEPIELAPITKNNSVLKYIKKKDRIELSGKRKFQKIQEESDRSGNESERDNKTSLEVPNELKSPEIEDFWNSRNRAQHIKWLNGIFSSWEPIKPEVPNNLNVQEYLNKHLEFCKGLIDNSAELKISELIRHQFSDELDLNTNNFKLFLYSVIYSHANSFTHKHMRVFIALVDNLYSAYTQRAINNIKGKVKLGDDEIRRTITKVKIPHVIKKRLMSID